MLKFILSLFGLKKEHNKVFENKLLNDTSSSIQTISDNNINGSINIGIDPYTDSETIEKLIRNNICPVCQKLNANFIEGPSDGLSYNIFCPRCGTRFWITILDGLGAKVLNRFELLMRE